MKKLAGLIIILAVLILGGYYGMGFLTERTIKKNIEVINQTNGLFANIEQYNRGWFSSDAQVKWRLHVPERIVKDANGASQTIPAQDYQSVMPIKICHGPFIFCHNKLRFGVGYAETEFPIPEQYAKQFDEQFTKESTKPQLDLNIFVNYFLRSSVELEVPEFKLIAKDGSGNFTWKGFASDVNVSSSKDQVDGDFVLNGLVFTKTDTKITLDKVTTEYDLHQTNAGLYLGDASFSLPSFDITVKNESMVNVKDLTMSSNSDIDDKLFNTHFSLGVKSILVNKKTYGPGELEISLRNLDAEILAKINQQTNAMQNGSEAERQQAMMAMLPELPKLFSKGAEFEISKCNFKIPEGSIDGNLLVSLPKGDNANPFELMQKIQGHAKLRAPAALVKQLMQQSVLQQMSQQPELQQTLVQQLQASNPTANQGQVNDEQLAALQADKQISTMEKNGLIVSSGSDYVIEVNLDQGKFNVNGKPFDPSMIKF
ncbi:YdgA family protein [Legionella sp. km772]|uniref:YdgA family protein n=1 Tax=Legionella sp. km772 TaxID=2498111 RepID=UPI000F8F15C3|nr:YdgA family protein [Legionella sp. km772]RUR13010.1 DUF945 domain-containing protein [Legionella sp. km772]